MLCTGISLLAEYVVLEYPYWLNMLYWNIPTDRIFCTGISLPTVYFVLTEYFVLQQIALEGEPPRALHRRYAAQQCTNPRTSSRSPFVPPQTKQEWVNISPTFSLPPCLPPLSKSAVLKYDLLLVFQKQSCLDTKSKCQYGN
jgi:hypothetical protein